MDWTLELDRRHWNWIGIDWWLVIAREDGGRFAEVRGYWGAGLTADRRQW
ncbi:MAG: hypothetical protein NNA23_00170 [Nitrospira sp.]|nr:hypothetical protein [Nitrospira sp.]MCP9464875.1 hypothetical protein [Nitrospira sp.]